MGSGDNSLPVTDREPGADRLEDGTHVFIVRVWDERRGAANQPPEVRGTIEHLPSGKRGAFRDLRAIVRFIAAYLPPTTLRARIARRLRRYFGA